MRIFEGINLNISDLLSNYTFSPGYKVKMFRDQNFSCSLRLIYAVFYSNLSTLLETPEILRTDFMILTYKVSSTF